MKLYLLDRVKNIENSEEFKELHAIAQQRSARASEAAAERKAAVESTIDELDINVPVLDKDVVVQRACEHYNCSSRSDLYGLATENSDAKFLDRICVNYLRHVCTLYDAHLRSVYKTCGASDHRLAIKEKVLDAIADAYPELAAECSRQVREAYDKSLRQT